MEQITEIVKKLGENLDFQSIITALIAFIIGFILIKLIVRLTNKTLEKCKIDSTLHKFIKSAVKILLYVIMAIVLAGTLGIEISSIIALLSVVGLAVSLAVQDSLANAASGIMILITKPFVKGDYVDIGSVSGTVDAVGLVNTTLLTIDNKMIFVPNSTVSAENIVNYSHETTRRIEIKINVSYKNSTEAVKAALLEAAQMSNDKILKEPSAFAALSEYGESSVEYLLRVWASVDDYWDVYFKIMEDIRVCFDRQGIEMTYNHVIIHKEDN